MKPRIHWTPERDERLLELYRDKQPAHVIATMIGVGKSTMYRRLAALKEKARYPGRKLRTYKTPLVPYRQAHRLVREMFRAAKHQHVGTRELADHCKVQPESLTTWNRGGRPSLKNLERAGDLVGLRLVWEKAA